MHLTRPADDQPGNARQHPVAEVHAVDEPLTVDELVQHDVVLA